MSLKANHLYIEPQKSKDLEIIQCGIEECKSNHIFGPAVRGYHLIHYVVSGKGVYYNSKKTLEVGAGQAFLIVPGDITIYQADEISPWTYIWIGFSGDNVSELLKRIDISKDSPTDVDKTCEIFFANMVQEREGNIVNDGFYNALRAKGELLRFFSHRAQKNKKEPVRSLSDRIIDYFRSNISENITIEKIASDFGYSRTYFSEKFKSEKGMPPFQYLQDYRMSQAKEMLITTKHQVSHIARSVGYSDPLLFSRQFKKKAGLSPSKYRESNKKN